MSDLNRKLFWLTALRLLIVVSITGPYALYRLGVPEELPANGAIVAEKVLLTPGRTPLLDLLAIVSVQTLLYIALLKFLRRHPTVHAYLQFGGDVALVTFLMYRLGEAGPNFSLFYFVVIAIASVLVRRSAGIVTATFAALCFTLMFSGPSWGLLQFLESRLALPPSPLSYLLPETRAYSFAAHLAGFYAVAFLTSYLARDVTRAEERLRAQNLDLAYLQVVHRDVVQSIPSGLATTDLNGIVTSVNRSAEKLLERSAADTIGVHVSETGLVDPEGWEQLTELSGDGARRREFERHHGGETVHLGLTLSHLRDGEGGRRGYILVLEDLTHERRLQEQLRLKDRMAAIGEMAAGLAHEVGNPLAAISGSAQVLASSFQGDESQRKLLEITLKEGRRLDRTVKSFLQLASSRQRRPADIDIAALVAEGIELLRNSDEIHDRHVIEANLDPPSAIVRADPDQIGQIFWNLVRNALQAMPAGGKLQVTGRLDGALYRLSFFDTGSGMTEEEMADLFHPFKSFFDKGTGIGMAIVYRIVEEHGGKITAESLPGEGTVIRVELPVAGPPPAGPPAPKGRSPQVRTPKEQETVEGAA